ncbi:hypothetical protein FHR75_000993 [Kineococcus radiotolerans]|uniref:DUF4245 domain-containing protein n=1 Tax=Kineococcus radiotolerans TaxID=131568 RepID=A0A7W4TJT8_KINRA|nr:DUF4245 domain-containing protein [Kineococcus radiotolerans]MBB2900205.1 hypothetical protein [Kineococcus radiotolerans]
MSTTGSPDASTSPAGGPSSGEDPRGVPRGPRRGGNVQSMVLSMAVILALVAVVIWLVPRPNAIEQPAVDVVNAAQGAAGDLSFAPAVPAGPAGWTPTSANVNRSTDDVITWHVGYRTDEGEYLALEVARDTTPGWLKAQTQSGAAQGTRAVRGQDWNAYLQEDRRRYSLVRTQDGVSVLVTGEGGYDVLAELATATLDGWDAAGTPWGAKA